MCVAIDNNNSKARQYANVLHNGHTTLFRRWINVIDVDSTFLTTPCVQWVTAYIHHYYQYNKLEAADF